MSEATVTDLAPEVKQFYWSEWPEGHITTRQANDKRLVPGPIRGKIWYKRNSRDNGHWIYLHLESECQPKPARTEAQIAAAEKRKETQRKNRQCQGCGDMQRYKDDLYEGLCSVCCDHNTAIERAKELLAVNPVFIDTETTGFHGSEILAISVINLSGEVLLNTLIKPINPIDETSAACEVNGILNSMVEHQPSFPQVHEKLINIFKDRAVIAYNMMFDHARLEENCKMHNLPMFEAEVWDCAMDLYAWFNGEWSWKYESYKWQPLWEACQTLGIEPGDHTAARDADAARLVVKAMAEQPPRKGNA